MKTLLLASVLFLSIQATAQSSLKGKMYEAKIGEACKLFDNGGCMLYTYCVLAFTGDSVHVYYRQYASCSDEQMEKKYLQPKFNSKTSYWKMNNSAISIDHFQDYGILTFENDTIVATNNEANMLYFLRIN